MYESGLHFPSGAEARSRNHQRILKQPLPPPYTLTPRLLHHTLTPRRLIPNMFPLPPPPQYLDQIIHRTSQRRIRAKNIHKTPQAHQRIPMSRILILSIPFPLFLQHVGDDGRGEDEDDAWDDEERPDEHVAEEGDFEVLCAEPEDVERGEGYGNDGLVGISSASSPFTQKRIANSPPKWAKPPRPSQSHPHYSPHQHWSRLYLL